MQTVQLQLSFISKGCQQNYHKRCVVKVPNNCSRIDVTKSRVSQVRSPSGSSNSSNNIEDQQSPSSSLVRKMQQLMHEISN